MSFFLRVVLNAVAIWLTTLLLGTNFRVVGGDSTVGVIAVYLGVALVFALVNSIIKPFLQVISLPFYILTLGLFGVIVNALVLQLVGWITGHGDWGLRIDGFWWAALAGLIVSILNAVLTSAVPEAKPHH